MNKIGRKLLSTVAAASLLISAQAANLTSYRDVPKAHWAYDAIWDMTERDMFSGTASPVNGVGTFSPNQSMTRAQFVAVLTRYLYPDELSETPTTPWYKQNYDVALKHGLLTFDDLDTGDLKQTCTRQEMAMMLVRAAYLKNGEVAQNLLPIESIADYNSIDKRYQQYVRQAFSMGLIAGVDSKGTFSPRSSLNRAQAAVVIYRLIDPTTRVGADSTNQITYTWKNGTTYTGQYSNGEANGYGTMTFPKVGTYTGYFVNGLREGTGTFKWNVGDSYTGMWNHDKMCGAGTYKFADGYTIKGTWSDNQIAATALSMNPSSVSMRVSATAKIVVNCTPKQITEPISWSSSDSSIVTVAGSNNMGTLTAKKVGTATVTATTKSGKKTQCDVTVTNDTIQKIELNYGDYSLESGETLSLSAKTYPSNTNSRALTWKSSDSSVASVTSNGYVRAVSAGSAIISAESDNGLVATCYVTVKPKAVLWEGSWTMYAANSSGRVSSSTPQGTCTIDDDELVLNLESKYLPDFTLKTVNSFTRTGTYTDDTETYDIALTSINEDKVVLEIIVIDSHDRVSETSYYALLR